jgi:two-component system NtrC family sensor kinase
MEPAELRRLILRHRHVGPMLSVLLAGTDARVTISDLEGTAILDRQGGAATGNSPVERHPITVEGRAVGWVEGPRPSASIAAVLSYAASRETDKRALAAEALDRYRELSLIYDLSESIGTSLDVAEVASVAAQEASRLPSGGEGFVVLRDGPDGSSVESPRS